MGPAMSSLIRESSGLFSSSLPRLASGDRLDAEQFWARYQVTPEVTAERIRGRVFVMSPLRAAGHGDPHALLAGWLFHFAMHREHVIVSDNATIRLDADNDPQPDLCMRIIGGATHM